MNNEKQTVQANYDQPTQLTPEAPAMPGLEEHEQPWSGPEAADTQDPRNVAEAEAGAVEDRESTGETRGTLDTGIARTALTILPRVHRG